MNGILFASRAEMRHYAELLMRQRAGLIRNLELQPAFILQAPYVHKAKKIRALVYMADFAYDETDTGAHIVEDVKGHRTPVFELKKKILLFKYPDIDFREVKAR